jgi:hypothetical protein
MVRRPSDRFADLAQLPAQSGVGYRYRDMLVMAFASFRLRYLMINLGHGCKRIMHTPVTEIPTAAWLSRQFTEALLPSYAPIDNR